MYVHVCRQIRCSQRDVLVNEAGSAFILVSEDIYVKCGVRMNVEELGPECSARFQCFWWMKPNERDILIKTSL
jgi:hypothetical protein